MAPPFFYSMTGFRSPAAVFGRPSLTAPAIPSQTQMKLQKCGFLNLSSASMLREKRKFMSANTSFLSSLFLLLIFARLPPAYQLQHFDVFSPLPSHLPFCLCTSLSPSTLPTLSSFSPQADMPSVVVRLIGEKPVPGGAF